jgi:hypothetical protein
VHFTSTDAKGVLPADYTFTPNDAGVHNFVVTLRTSGPQSIAVTDTEQAAISGQASGIQVQPGALRGFVATFPATQTAGDSAALLVLAEDAFGNRVTSYTGTIHFTSDDSHASLPADYTFAAADRGSHTFTATLETAGIRAIRASDKLHPSLTGLASGLSVRPALATRVLVWGYPATTTVGTPNPVVVTLHDAYGNVATGYTGTIHFSSDDGLAVLPADWTFTAADAGTRTFTVTFGAAGTHHVTVWDTRNPRLSGEEAGIVVA